MNLAAYKRGNFYNAKLDLATWKEDSGLMNAFNNYAFYNYGCRSVSCMLASFLAGKH